MQVYVNLAARRSTADSGDVAKPHAAASACDQVQAQPERAAKSTAKRKWVRDSTAPGAADPGASVAATSAEVASPDQPVVGIVKLPGSERAPAPQEPAADQHMPAIKAKLALVEDDVDWDGQAAPE